MHQRSGRVALLSTRLDTQRTGEIPLTPGKGDRERDTQVWPTTTFRCVTEPSGDANTGSHRQHGPRLLFFLYGFRIALALSASLALVKRLMILSLCTCMSWCSLGHTREREWAYIEESSTHGLRSLRPPLFSPPLTLSRRLLLVFSAAVLCCVRLVTYTRNHDRPHCCVSYLIRCLAPTCSLSLALHGRGALGNWQQNSLSRTTGSAAHRLEAFALRTITTSRLNLRYSTTCALISLDHAQEKGPGL